VWNSPRSTAGVATKRQVRQQGRIEFPAAEGRIELLGIHAAQRRAQAAVDHLPRELRGVAPEQRKHRRPAQPCTQRLAPRTHVVEEEIAECDLPAIRPTGARLRQRIGERRLVRRVVALRRDRRLDHRQARRGRLGVQQIAADAVHRDASKPEVTVVTSATTFDPRLRPRTRVQRPGRILSTAPGQHGCVRRMHAASSHKANTIVARPSRSAQKKGDELGLRRQWAA
jgi:hypothetical protein